ncbi:MAG: hypothetical protein GY854_14905 [Deltaproteobacteria bacterium]|nr:hypothetical protein [Deltaproteobacteria bacterium]
MKHEICSDCVKFGDCQIREEHTRPIVRCDQYKRQGDTTEVSSAGDEFSRGEGVCATCEIRKTCSRRQVEGGVWHCADYL